MIKSKGPELIAYTIGFGIGIAVGLYIGRRYYQAKYEALLEQELALSKHYKHLREQKVQRVQEVVDPITPDVVEVFTDDNPYNIPWDPRDLDYEEEMKHRSDEAPYVISKNEFDNDMQEYEKISIEYYQMEDVILDDRVSPIPDKDILVGDNNLKRFGEGSGDRRLVYIRNEELETDWEVRLMMGSYLTDVLGLEDPEDQETSDERNDR